MDNVDTDEAARQTAKGLGVPDSIIRPSDQVAQFRQKKQAAAAQAQQQQLGMDVTGDVLKSAGSAAANRMVAQQ
jgi:hypothetical protein